MTSSELLREADMAMYQDKMSHLNKHTPEQRDTFINLIKSIRGLEVRDRDIPKFIDLYTKQGLL